MKFGRNVRCILFDLGSTLWTSKDERLMLASERIANLRAVLELFRFTGTGVYADMDVDELGKLLRKSFEKQIRVKTRQLSNTSLSLCRRQWMRCNKSEFR